MQIATDASTIAVFDLEALRHRIDADGDWWTCPEFPELQEEIACGNIYLIDTHHDGIFDVTIETEELDRSRKINVPSGTLYIVCGEEIPAEGLTPELIRGGAHLDLKSNFAVVSHRVDGNRIRLCIRET